MTVDDFTGLISDVWTTWAPGILTVAGVLVGAAVAIYLGIRFAPSIATKIFSRGK